MSKKDIEIAQATQMLPIEEIAGKLSLDAEKLDHYGKYKAKVDFSALHNNENNNGKLVLMTAINPTPAGKEKRQRQ